MRVTLKKYDKDKENPKKNFIKMRVTLEKYDKDEGNP